MKIIFEFTEKEKQLLMLFHNMGNLSTKNNFGGWGGTVEFKALRDNKLIKHYNHTDFGDYIRYRLTKLGELAVKQISGTL